MGAVEPEAAEPQEETYTVTAPTAVLGYAPHAEFKATLDPKTEARLIRIGALSKGPSDQDGAVTKNSGTRPELEKLALAEVERLQASGHEVPEGLSEPEKFGSKADVAAAINAARGIS